MLPSSHGSVVTAVFLHAEDPGSNPATCPSERVAHVERNPPPGLLARHGNTPQQLAQAVINQPAGSPGTVAAQAETRSQCLLKCRRRRKAVRLARTAFKLTLHSHVTALSAQRRQTVDAVVAAALIVVS
uniref:Uncharacterized protein n=1 Tax=Cacopsylla melanoneura TaxID=428564 RepID=A0A8D8V6J7_9HEMI